MALDSGEYDLLNGVVGIVCGLILLAFYRPLPSEDSFDATTGAWAFGAVAGLQVASALSWLIQLGVNWVVDNGSVELGKGCRDRAECLGDTADLPVVIVWALAAVILRYRHPRRFSHVPSGA